MELTVLGKYGPYPAACGGTSSYLLNVGETNIALDFGSGACGRYRKFCARLDAIVLSHLHFDHVCDLLPLVYEAELDNRIVPLYMPFDGCEICELLKSRKVFDVRQIRDGTSIRLGEAELTFTRLIHPAESYGIRVNANGKSFFYSGDTSYTEKAAEAAKGCAVALLDAAQPEDIPDDFPHMSVKHAATIADKIGARVIVTHVNPLINTESQAKKLGLETAEEFKTYRI